MDVNHQQLKFGPQGRIVDALKRLGGIAALPDLYAVIGDDLPRATVRSTLQTYSSDATWERPTNAEDLFYSVNGVGARSGIWGLRGFVPQMPETYPLADLPRPYTRLLKREETSLILPSRGIAYKDGHVHGIQVNFTARGSDPDELKTDGSIHHIGEGLKVRRQEPNAGNGGILAAIKTGIPIPVFQYVAPNQYAALGDYRAVDSFRRTIRLENNDFETEAFVFVLQPLTVAVDRGVVSEGEVNDLIRESGNMPETMKPEGRRVLRTHLAAERSPGNRAAVLRLKGYRCEACDFHFGERYGPEIDGFIEVHHTRPVSIGENIPSIESDFAVLCANCHRAAHTGRGLEPRSVEQLRQLLKHGGLT